MTSSATSPETARAPDRFEPRSALRRLVFGNLWRTLAGLLGVMQALVLQWAAIVLLGIEGLGTGVFLGLSAILVAGNLATVPLLRQMRFSGGESRRAARVYMAVGIGTLLVGMAVAISWLALFPAATAVGWLGLGETGAFALFRGASVVWVGAVALCTVWAFTGGQRGFDRTRVVVPIAGLHESHCGLEIVHLTDLHIGNGLEGEHLDALVEHANALEPDVIVLTGDIFDFDPSYVEDGARRLAGLQARLGVYAVLGNHDVHTGADHVAEGLQRLAPGIRLLRGEIARLPGPEPLYIAGVEDPGRDWTNRSVHLEALDTLAAQRRDDGPTLLLVHRPQAFEQAAKLGFPLVLAGHTHGGQLALPFRAGQSLNLARIMTGYTRGLFQMRASTMYVSRGVGVAGPAARFNCARELATIELA
jgi:predicted MPP superfamily phosphohydrolase